MTKNPFYNALAALVYILAIVLGMTAMSGIQNSVNEFVMPLIMLSLLTLSVAVMAFIFGYQPLTLFLDGKKEKAVKLFLKTVVIFGGITFGIILIYYFYIL